jgi:3'-5' exoribonuclease
VGQPQPQRPGGLGPQKKKRPERPERRPEPKPEGEAAAASPEAQKVEGAAAAPHADRPERRDRPERGPRPDRGGPGVFRGGTGAPGGAGGFGDKKRSYTGPRLPGDRGPQARPKASTSLTHNPFAALAQKIEASGEAPPPPAEACEAPAPADAQPHEAPAVEARQQGSEVPSTETPSTAAPGVAETPAPGDVPADGST